MASLFFTCPKTNQRAPAGIETDVQSLGACWKAVLKVNCPHCGDVHETSVRETYINGALQECHRPITRGHLGPRVSQLSRRTRVVTLVEESQTALTQGVCRHVGRIKKQTSWQYHDMSAMWNRDGRSGEHRAGCRRAGPGSV
jgi:hypothetical protein